MLVYRRKSIMILPTVFYINIHIIFYDRFRFSFYCISFCRCLFSFLFVCSDVNNIIAHMLLCYCLKLIFLAVNLVPQLTLPWSNENKIKRIYVSLKLTFCFKLVNVTLQQLNLRCLFQISHVGALQPGSHVNWNGSVETAP